ncbi:MAG TPA: hypothetical protein ENN85_09650 [Methanoculleus sp.]|nr:hypothetical protein [Methanoculleus sp.]
MNEQLLIQAALHLAPEIGAKVIVAFTTPCEIESAVPIIWVHGLQLDVLKDLTMSDILEVSESHLLDAAVQIYLSRQFEEGQVIGVFPYALLIYDIKEGKDFISVKDFEDIASREVMHAVLTLALEIAHEGREGHSIGTAFIIGNGDAILARSHQAILNPYHGQPAEYCDIRNRDNWESIKEFAQLDGVFVVDAEGRILAAGRYLDVNASSVHLPGGLGGRHRATAAITNDLPVAGITVSESGGTLRVFRNGECKLSIRSNVRLTTSI